MKCKKRKLFIKIRKKLLDKFPQCIKKEIYFIANGKKVDESKSLLKNNITNDTVILLQKMTIVNNNNNY